MALKREFKIGILATLALIIAITGTQYLKGKKFFSTDQVFFVEYQDGQMITEATPVVMSGIQVGSVKRVYLKPEDLRIVVAELYVKRWVKVPKNTIAEIISTSMLGSKAILLSFTDQCVDGNCATSGTYLKGNSRSMLESMVPRQQLNSYVSELQKGLTGVLDTFNTQLSDPNSKYVLSRTMQDMQQTMESLKLISAKLDRILGSMANDLTTMSHNMAGITANLNNNNSHITGILKNMDQVSGQLASNSGSLIKQTEQSIQQAQTTMKTLNNVSMQLHNTLDRVNNAKGSLGLLLNDKSLYNSLKKTSDNLSLLTQDLRLNPKRYISLSLLGGKGTPYVLPQNDPADTLKSFR